MKLLIYCLKLLKYRLKLLSYRSTTTWCHSSRKTRIKEGRRKLKTSKLSFSPSNATCETWLSSIMCETWNYKLMCETWNFKWMCEMWKFKCKVWNSKCCFWNASLIIFPVRFFLPVNRLNCHFSALYSSFAVLLHKCLNWIIFRVSLDRERVQLGGKHPLLQLAAQSCSNPKVGKVAKLVTWHKLAMYKSQTCNHKLKPQCI